MTLAGCGNPFRFDAEMRSRCFDRVWSRFEHEHCSTEHVGRLAPWRHEIRDRVKHAKTRREYVVTLARFLSEFRDPHIGFESLADYFQLHTRDVLTCVVSRATLTRDHLLVEFAPDALAADPTRPTPLERGRVYDVLAVDGVPASVLAADLLQGQPGELIDVLVRLPDGHHEIVSLCAPQPRIPGLREMVDTDPGPLFETPNVVSLRLEHGAVGYIRLFNVRGQRTVQAFDRALNSLIDADALILDLRSNGGGTTDVLEAILGRFVAGVRTYATFDVRLPPLLTLGLLSDLALPAQVWGRGPVYRGPLVVLVDGSTGSCAELLATALREERGAVLVGQPTAGAGAVLARATLPDGLEITYGTLLIRDSVGAAFQAVGVQPDILVPLDVIGAGDDAGAALSDWKKRIVATGVSEALRRADR